MKCLCWCGNPWVSRGKWKWSIYCMVSQFHIAIFFEKLSIHHLGRISFLLEIGSQYMCENTSRISWFVVLSVRKNNKNREVQPAFSQLNFHEKKIQHHFVQLCFDHSKFNIHGWCKWPHWETLLKSEKWPRVLCEFAVTEFLGSWKMIRKYGGDPK